MLPVEVQKLIVSYYQAGKRIPEIHSIVKSLCTYYTVRNVVQHWIRTGGYRTGAKPPKKQSKERKDALNRAIRNLTKAAQQNSIRGQARKQGIDRSAIPREMKKRGIKVYRKVIRPFITEAQKVARKRCAQRFRKRYRKSDIPNFVFVDECYVLVGEYLNSQQERCYGKSFELIPDSKKHKRLQKSPLKAMIFGGVWRDGRTRSPIRVQE
ncbi:hypothetical protein RvY_11935 [Ramazzottius varieornatus]|uniref:Paired domain-containing protein n=1 Tax=Ramazzottius varieornatus TaxID=947166 RepID=A0A1D1VK60_RAMVA|nr:hypothetical protein RvY_11935 [Ramazzottius varieornatus]